MLERDSISAYIMEIIPRITEIRRKLHQNPEIAGKEVETRNILKEVTDTIQPLYWQPKLGTDLVFEIPGRDPGKVIGLRSDIDALPLLEQTELPYISHNPGMMHACGHDGHMSIMLGVAMIAKKFQTHLPHTVRFIFQPGEEEACLGAELVEKGVCDGLSAVYALHTWPGLPVGSVSAKPGIMFAAADSFYVTIKGQGTHGAAPEKGNNPLIPTADIVMRLQNLHHRFKEESGAVISVCAVQGGSNSNVIPAETLLQGTTRYTETTVGDAIETAVKEEIRKAAESCGVDYKIAYDRKYHIPVINDPEQTEIVQQAVDKVLGQGAFIPAKTHNMVAEDFAFYLDKVPGCMFWLGAGRESPNLHSQVFNFNDDSLHHGMMVFSSLMFGDNLI